MGLLLLSTLIIIMASALAYARLVYEKTLNVGNTGGVTAGSGSTASTGMSLALATIVILTVPALATSLSIFGFRHKLSTRISDTPSIPNASPTGRESVSPRTGELDESPSRKLDEDTMKIFREILDPEPETSATTA